MVEAFTLLKPMANAAAKRAKRLADRDAAAAGDPAAQRRRAAEQRRLQLLLPQRAAERARQAAAASDSAHPGRRAGCLLTRQEAWDLAHASEWQPTVDDEF